MASPCVVTVRASDDSDVPAIQAIYAYHVEHGQGTFELDPPSVEEMGRRRQVVLQDGLPYLVAEIEGQVVGYCYAGKYRERPAYCHTLEDSIYISREHHRRGVGAKLLDAILERVEKTTAARQLIAVVGGSDNAGSIGLHRSRGFAEVGVLRSVGWKFGKWHDCVILQKSIGPGDSVGPGESQAATA